MSEQVWWYLARAAGIVTLVLLVAGLVLGILLSTRALKPHDRPAWLLAMHRWFSTLVVVGVGVHVLALVLDSFVSFGPREILVPMTSRWRPVAVSFGVIAMYLLVAVHLSSVLMKRIPKTWWRRMHGLSALLVWCAVVHGALAGTDVANPAYQAVSWTLLFGSVGAGLVRVVMGRSAARGREARSGGGRPPRREELHHRAGKAGDEGTVDVAGPRDEDAGAHERPDEPVRDVAVGEGERPLPV